MGEFPLDKQSYELIHMIAQTETASIYVARCVINGRLVCAKLIDMELFPIDKEKLRKQICFWASSNTYNLIRYYGAFTVDSTLWILCEYMDGGSISDILQFAYPHGFKDEYLLASILEQVVHFLVYWHSSKQIHRNIKPATILASSDGSIKVGSLGCATGLLSNGLRKSSTHTITGTICYTAPEVLSDEKKGYTEKADIWSLGITAIELATGKNPYSTNYDPNKDSLKIIEQIVKGQPPELSPSCGFSQKFMEFVKMCLQTKPEKRMSAKHLLQSAFIKQSKGRSYVSSTLMYNLPLLYQRFEIDHPGMTVDESKKWVAPEHVDFNFCGADVYPTPITALPRIRTSSSSEKIVDNLSSSPKSNGKFAVTIDSNDLLKSNYKKSESGSSVPEMIVSDSFEDHESSTEEYSRPSKSSDTTYRVGRFTVTYKASSESPKSLFRAKSDMANLMKRKSFTMGAQLTETNSLRNIPQETTSLSPPTTSPMMELRLHGTSSAITIDNY